MIPYLFKKKNIIYESYHLIKKYYSFWMQVSYKKNVNNLRYFATSSETKMISIDVKTQAYLPCCIEWAEWVSVYQQYIRLFCRPVKEAHHEIGIVPVGHGVVEVDILIACHSHGQAWGSEYHIQDNYSLVLVVEEWASDAFRIDRLQRSFFFTTIVVSCFEYTQKYAWIVH